MGVRQAVGVALLGVLLSASGAEARSSQAVPFVFGAGTARIDGVKSPGEWDAAGKFDLTVNRIGGGTMPATFYVMNDATTMYVGFEVARATPGRSVLSLDFRSGTTQLLVDKLDLPEVGGAVDQYGLPGGASPADTSDGGTNDVLAATKPSGSATFFELSHPLDDGDDRHDFSLSAGDTVYFGFNFLECAGFACAPYVVGQNPFNIVVTPLVDLAVSQTVRPKRVRVGKLATFTMNVRSLSAASTLSANLFDKLPGGLKFVSATASGRRCFKGTSGRGFICVLSPLAGGARVTVRFVARATRPGRVVNTPKVTGSKAESNTRNNSASATLIVTR